MKLHRLIQLLIRPDESIETHNCHHFDQYPSAVIQYTLHVHWSDRCISSSKQYQ